MREQECYGSNTRGYEMVVERARDAAARADWDEAFDLFMTADAGGLVSTADLPVLAEVAHAAGHSDPGAGPRAVGPNVCCARTAGSPSSMSASSGGLARSARISLQARSDAIRLTIATALAPQIGSRRCLWAVGSNPFSRFREGPHLQVLVETAERRTRLAHQVREYSQRIEVVRVLPARDSA
jgi:hypothetical protein